jgi:hypothetical protein
VWAQFAALNGLNRARARTHDAIGTWTDRDAGEVSYGSYDGSD